MIYLDNSATTKPNAAVLESFLTVSTNYFANPSSLHRLGGEAEALLSQARKQIADLLHVKATEIYFTSGGTESNNTAIKGIAYQYSNRGKHIITTEVEHDSVTNVMKELEAEGFTITYIPVNKDGFVDIKDIRANIREETILVSVMHVNNEIGTIQPIKEIGSLLKQFPKIYFHVDAVQGIGKCPISINDANIDLYTLSSHKFHGVKGTGVLYIKEGIKIQPLLIGGGQERKLRSGTENVAGAVATAKALRMLVENSEKKNQSLQKQRDVFYDALKDLRDVVIHTPLKQSAPHIINFSILGAKAEVIVHKLEEQNIYVSTTSACSSKNKKISKTLTSMGIQKNVAESSIRISLSYENTMEEIQIAIKAIEQTIEWIREVVK